MSNLRRLVLLLVCMLMIVGLTTTASADKPTILDCSSGTIYAAAGETVTLFVEADSNGKSFFWEAINDYTLPENESRHTSTYTFTMTPELDGALIICRVATQSGWYYTYSDDVWINLPLLRITKHPEDAKLVAGMEAKTSIEATGDQITYQWYSCYENEDYVPVSCTGSELSMTLTKPGRHLFYCEVTDRSGQKRKSYMGRFDVYAPVYIDIDIRDDEALVGNTVRFSTKAIGCDVTYQWYYKDSSSKNFTPLSGENSTDLSLTMYSETNGAQVYCIATDAAGNTARTSIATATIDSSIVIRGDCSICGGDGNCNRCGGRGWYWADSRNPFAPHDQVDCDAELCLFGTCMGCGGNGWIGSKKDKPGDANMDSKVNTTDVLMILQYAAGWNVSPNERTSNVSNDNYINARDAVLILQNIAGN